MKKCSFFKSATAFFEKHYWMNVASRWIVGLVFLFSSFVKGVDPMGTMFKVEEYMSSWSLFGSTFEWALPLAEFLAVTLICAEFLVGVMLIFNSFRVISAWLLALMMTFFTVTTFVDAVTNLVDDCGCFGDALKLTNWQTFWKNVFLDVFTVVICLSCRTRYRRRLERDIIVLLIGLVVMLVFCIYNIKNEPIIDFRPWKVGNKMVKHQEPMNYLKYFNKETQQTVELKYKNGEYASHAEEWAQYDDTVVWECVESGTTPEFVVLADGFSMLAPDEQGNLSLEQTLNVLPDSNGVLFVTVYDIEKVDEDGINEIKDAVALVKEEKGDGKIRIVLLTSMGRFDENPLVRVQTWLSDNKIDGIQVNVLDLMGENNVYFADAKAIQTIMRGNPGFMFMKNGVVVDKGRKARELKIENSKQ